MSLHDYVSPAPPRETWTNCHGIEGTHGSLSPTGAGNPKKDLSYSAHLAAPEGAETDPPDGTTPTSVMKVDLAPRMAGGDDISLKAVHGWSFG